MLYNTLHNRWLRLVAAVVGELIAAAALNLFIVPLHLYTGGILGVCQLARTLMTSQVSCTSYPTFPSFCWHIKHWERRWSLKR